MEKNKKIPPVPRPETGKDEYLKTGPDADDTSGKPQQDDHVTLDEIAREQTSGFEHAELDDDESEQRTDARPRKSDAGESNEADEGATIYPDIE